jgi:hypothetical protein
MTKERNAMNASFLTSSVRKDAFIALRAPFLLRSYGS